MLLEEIDESANFYDNYSVEEACIVVRAYLQTMTFEDLWTITHKGPNLTVALRRVRDDV